MELASLARHKNQWWLRALTAISPIIAVLFILGIFLMVSTEEIAVLAHLISQSSGEPASGPSRPAGGDSPGTGSVLWALFKISGWGLWLMAVGMLLCAISVRLHPGRKKPVQKLPAVPADGHGAGAPSP